MKSADVFAQIERMGGLPSLPQNLLRIQQVATDDRSSADDLAMCILKDQALTMRVLKVVNSAMYQRRGQEPVRTVRKAVIVLGFETVRKLALGLSVFDMMSKLSRSPWLADVTRHSLITAAFAQILAEASGRVPPEEAFVTALVHDIGKVVLLECSPEAMDRVLADMEQGLHGLDAERRHFGLTHGRAGRALGIPSARLDDVYARVVQEIMDLAGCVGMEVGNLGHYGALVNAEGSAMVTPPRLTPEEIARRTAMQLELYREVGTGLANGDTPGRLIDRVLKGPWISWGSSA